MGSLVGAAYAAGALDILEQWARSLSWSQVLRYFDLSTGGGLIRATRVLTALESQFHDRAIEDLERPYAAVATNLADGREVCLRTGSLFAAVHASAAMPGLVSPVRRGDAWLVDGGLVNAIPVSVCRQLGADIVIAVDLQTTLFYPDLPRRSSPADPEPAGARVLDAEPPGFASDVASDQEGEGGAFWRSLRLRAAELRQQLGDRDSAGESDRATVPSIQEVLTKCMDIVQYRIARSRLAGDPPELRVVPRLPRMGTLDFHRAGPAIEEGRRAAERALASLP